jgi:8-oxo-dGTP pyrophosphatase MutT (NUDIX family)
MCLSAISNIIEKIRMTLYFVLSPAFKTLQTKYNNKKKIEESDFVLPKPFPKRFKYNNRNEHAEYRRMNGESDKVYGIILISKSNRIALVEGRKELKWSFPKGHSYKNEDPVDCVKREAREEIGIENIEQLGNINKDGFKRLVTGYYQIIQVDEEFELKPQDKDEIIQAKWVDFNELRNIDKNIDLTHYYNNIKKMAL